MAFHAYMLRCADGSYYCGHTDDMDARMRQHEVGEIGHTATRKPVELVWVGEFESRAEALAFELKVKGWSRAKKEALIAGDWKAIQRLAWGTRNPLPTHLRDEAGPSIPQDERSEVQVARDEKLSGLDEDGARLGDERAGRGVEQVGQEKTVRPEVSKDSAYLHLAQDVLANNRRAIAKAITLIESTRADHRMRADALLDTLLPHTGKALRLGISGVPGVGKSTFIEALGLMLIERGHRVAVLTIDPSSSVSGGSILGDKTRMEQLSTHEAAYIRPSPSSGTLGGVAEKTREAMLVFEAAGYSVVIVETVGVGQSEIAVASMTDMFVLMQLPNAGDDLQAIKRGVMELADLVLINKADLDANAAARAEAQITGALRLLGEHPSDDRWSARVLQLSALKSQGIDVFWQNVERFVQLRRASGEFDTRRQQQGMAWMWDIIQSTLQTDFRRHPAVREALPDIVRSVNDARIAPSSAARTLLKLFTRS